MTTVTGLYNTNHAAEQTVRDLKAAHFSDTEISLVANGYHDSNASSDPASGAGTGAGTGAAVGGAVGVGAGLLAGLGLLAIPGVGPVVAAGWLVATAVGAVAGATAGAATGGLVGALTGEGVSHEHAQVYAEGVRRGGALVTVRVNSDQVSAAEEIMQRHGRVDVSARESAYRETGWTAFDETASPYTPAEIERERRLYP